MNESDFYEQWRYNFKITLIGFIIGLIVIFVGGSIEQKLNNSKEQTIAELKERN